MQQNAVMIAAPVSPPGWMTQRNAGETGMAPPSIHQSPSLLALLVSAPLLFECVFILQVSLHLEMLTTKATDVSPLVQSLC